MKLVVDSNALRSDQLRAFLKARRSNLAILIDYASVEAYKKNPLITVQRSMEILGEYPKQVRVLRSTGLIARQDSRKPKYVRRMVWDKYTKTFALHSASLPYIESGEPDMVEGAMRLHAKARELVDQMAPERFREFHEATTELFDPIQHSEIRKGRRSPGTLFQMLEMAAHVAAYQLSDDTVFRDYKLSEVINHFAVRHVLAKIILSQHWIRDGCPSVKDVRLQNDQIDAVFATYGTYFNGLMTADQPAARLHNDLRDCLTALAPSQGVILPKTRSSCCNVGPLADHLLQNAQKFTSVTFGVAFCQTDPDLIDRLVGRSNAFIADGGSKTFHPKLYYFRSGEKAEAIVGSSNFTSGGLNRNYEASLHLKGEAGDPAFAQIIALLETYAPIRRPVTLELARSYRVQFEAAKLLRKPKNPTLPGDGEAWRQVSSPLATMEWDEYLSAVRSGRYHVLGKRLDLLRTCQSLFASVGSFAELSPNEWKAIAGVIGEAQKRESGLDNHNWGWFGSMRGMGDFANRIREQDKWLASALDSIPRHGEVSKVQYDAYCAHLLRAFENSHRVGGVPTATRLLAMKRPDTFVCVSKPNAVGLAEALSFSRTTLELDSYWERIIEPIRISPWYNADRPNGQDGEIWDGRAAMLDAIYYDPS